MELPFKSETNGDLNGNEDLHQIIKEELTSNNNTLFSINNGGGIKDSNGKPKLFFKKVNDVKPILNPQFGITTNSVSSVNLLNSTNSVNGGNMIKDDL